MIPRISDFIPKMGKSSQNQLNGYCIDILLQLQIFQKQVFILQVWVLRKPQISQQL